MKLKFFAGLTSAEIGAALQAREEGASVLVLERFTGGVHIYGGDFFATTRSQWDPESLDEQPSDGDVIKAIFERANERMHRGG